MKPKPTVNDVANPLVLASEPDTDMSDVLFERDREDGLVNLTETEPPEFSYEMDEQ